MSEAKRVEDQYGVARSLRRERLSSDQRYRRLITEAEAEALRLQAEEEKLHGTRFPTRIERRRAEVLSLLHQGQTLKRIADELGTYASQVANDAYHLARQGLYPVPLRNPDDEEARRRNRVLRTWQFTTVKTPADVRKYLDLPEEVILSDLRWLTDHGYANTPSTPLPPDHEDQPRDDPTDRAPAPPRPQPQPPPTPPPRAPRVATSAELRADLSRRSPGPSGEYELVTSTQKKHSHIARVNLDGDGQTIRDETGHSHQVSRFYVESRDRHSHELTLPQP